MPVLVTCYKCGRKLRIHDHLIGRKTRCPICKSVFITEGNPPAPPAPGEWEIQKGQEIRVAPYGSAPPIRRPPTAPEEEEILEGVLRESPEELSQPHYPKPITWRQPRRIHPGNWEKVRTGLTLILMSVIVLCLTILAACGVIAFAFWSAKGNQPTNAEEVPVTAIALIVIIILMRLTSLVLSFIGNIFCLAAPEKHGAKTLATTVLILAGLAFAFDFLSLELRIVGLVALIITFIKFFLFMAFINALARCLNRRDLQDTVATTATLGGLTAGLWITTIVIAVVGIANGSIDPKQRDNPGTMTYFVGIFSCLLLIVGACFLFWYMRTLEQARDEIESYLRGS